MSRRSYRGLLKLPAYGLYGNDGELVASCRADGLIAANDLFRRYVTTMRDLQSGMLIRKVDGGWAIPFNGTQ